MSFVIDGSTYPGWAVVDLNCRAESVVSESEGSTSITLACMTDPGTMERHTIDIYTSAWAYIPVYEGMEVRFQYQADPVWWVNRWFALGYPGSESTILGGFDADYPNPPIYGTYFPPLRLSAGSSECPPEYDECYDSQRGAVHVTYGEVPYDVFDSTTGWIGSWGDYTLIVDTAEIHLNYRCTDVPGAWYTGLLFQSGWD